MPSRSLTRWLQVRNPLLAEVEAECLAVAAAVPPRPLLTDELLRGYVLLLSAQFQGLCRDLYAECTQAVMAASPPAMRFLIQRQCEANCQLETKNPSFETVSADFGRFGLSLTAWTRPGSPNQTRVTQVNLLNRWRNHAAHASPVPPAHPAMLTVVAVAGWRADCDGFATELDRELYNHLTAAIGVNPW